MLHDELMCTLLRSIALFDQFVCTDTSDIHYYSKFTHKDPTYIMMIFLTENRPKDCQVLFNSGTNAVENTPYMSGLFGKLLRSTVT